MSQNIALSPSDTSPKLGIYETLHVPSGKVFKKYWTEDMADQHRVGFTRQVLLEEINKWSGGGHWWYRLVEWFPQPKS